MRHLPRQAGQSICTIGMNVDRDSTRAVHKRCSNVDNQMWSINAPRLEHEYGVGDVSRKTTRQ
ncbi:MAG: hypothetical protein ACRD5K_18075 [Candidatus Acidiferrales bacterium]